MATACNVIPLVFPLHLLDIALIMAERIEDSRGDGIEINAGKVILKPQIH